MAELNHNEFPNSIIDILKLLRNTQPESERDDETSVAKGIQLNDPTNRKGE